MSTGENDTIADETVEAPVENSSTNRKQPFPQGFLDTISTGWAERPETLPAPRAQAPSAERRRAAVSAAFPGKRLVIPAGSLKQRSNDTDYRFRAVLDEEFVRAGHLALGLALHLQDDWVLPHLLAYGTDCTSLPGVADVACVKGVCTVSRCDRGWSVSGDATRCLKKGVAHAHNESA